MDPKRILVLTLYYSPDLSACSFRATALVRALQEQAPDVRIDVITTLPNRYGSFEVQAKELEANHQISIQRVRLPSHRSGMFDQAKAFTHFAREASRITKGQKYDLVFATSSRLMTASLGAWLARRGSAPLYLDIRDLFVDTIANVLPMKIGVLLKPLLTALERWTINRAVHVNLVSGGFGPYFAATYPRQSVSYFTNGIDDEFLPENALNAGASRVGGMPLRVLYAGNMGEGQGLHAIIPPLALRLGNRAQFRLIGDGGRRPELERNLRAAGTQNVELLAPMPRDSLIKEYLAADVLFLHLNDYEAFKKVLPSKIFEYAALGKPIWAGVSGYSAQFLDDEVTNAAVFPPCDSEQAIKVFEKLKIGHAPRTAFVRKFARRRIMQAMATELLNTLQPKTGE